MAAAPPSRSESFDAGDGAVLPEPHEERGLSAREHEADDDEGS